MVVDFGYSHVTKKEDFGRKFLWGDFDGARHLHYVAWPKVCLPKAYGGPGIKNLRMMNKTMLAKLRWQLVIQKEALWVQVLTHKYGHLLTEDNKKSVSSTWRSIRSSVDLLRAGIASSNYLDDTPNIARWNGHASGKFSVHSAYMLQLPPYDTSEQRKWNSIWALKGPSRGNFLLWRVSHENLLTGQFLFTHHVRNNPYCELCDADCEGILHSLRDCPWANKVWRRVISREKWISFSTFRHANEWVHANISGTFGSQFSSREWRYMFREIVGGIWFWRNKILHDDHERPPPDYRFISECISRVHSLFIAQFSEGLACLASMEYGQ